MGFLRLGFLSVYLSDQLVSGFTTGASVMVLTAQVDKALGVKINRYHGVGKLYYVSEISLVTSIIHLLVVKLKVGITLPCCDAYILGLAFLVALCSQLTQLFLTKAQKF